MPRKRRYTAKEVAAALEDAGGTVLLAAARLGCTPRTVYRYADRYSSVKEAMNDARADTYAEAQGRLVAMMKDKAHRDHRWAVDRILKTYGEQVNDGLDWSEKERHEHSGEAAPQAMGARIEIIDRREQVRTDGED